MVGVVVPVEENWVEAWESRNVGGVGRLLAIVLKEKGSVRPQTESREEGEALGRVVKGLLAREA